MPNDGVFYTVKLNIKRIQEEEDFIDDSFNAVIDDIDNKVVGISHLTSGAHWHIWEADTAYVVGDVIRWPAMKSHQYAKCIQAGTTSSTRPMVNVNGSEVTNGTTKWKIVSLTSTDDVNGGAIQIWQGGGVLYERGDAVLYASSLYRCKVASHKSSNNFEDDKDNWQEVYASVRPWENNKFYYENDVVIVDLFLYKCSQDHTSLSSFNLPAERSLWSLIGDFSTIKEWETDTIYIENQAVTINGILYRSLYTHTSDSENVYNDMDFWEPIFASIQLWMPDLYYGAGIVVLANNLLYKCTVPHTSESSFDLDKDNWSLIHTIPASIDDWSTDHEYLVNQIINYQGNIYRVTSDHTSGVNFDTTKFELMTDSINDWVASRDYVVGQYVNYKGSLYKCITANNDANFTTTKWQKVSGGGIDTWTSNNDYSVGDIVVYNNRIYSCNTGHTSGSTFLPDENKWTEISACITRIPDWEITTDYVVGDLVAHDAKIYRCITAHTSGSTWDATEELKWEELSPTINEISTWTPSTDYAVGQLVIHNNKLYRCTTAHTSTSAFDITKWEEISPTKLDDWQASTDYSVGDYVVNANKIYKCTIAHTSTSTFDKSKWVEISSYDIELWQPSTDYIVGNLVIQDNKIYRCNTAHTSDTTSFGVDIANWDEIGSSGIDSWEQNKLYSTDNIVIYSNKIYKCITGHTSSTTFDPTKWVEVSSSDIDAWSASTDYVVGDFVYKDNQLYRCITAHTSDSSDFDVDIAKWELLDTKWKAENWVASKLYTANEVVLYDNRIFKCVSTHTSAVDFATDANYWQALSAKLEPWKVSTYYTVGDTVINNNKLYKCIVAHTSNSTSISVDLGNWEIVGSGGIDTWKSNEDYTTSSVVIYNNKIYKCNTAHTSGSTFDPTKWDEISSADTDLWQVSTAYKVGNLVINNNQIYRCKTAHTSSSVFNSDISNWDILDTKWQAKDWVTNTYYLAGEVVLYNNTPYKCIIAHTSLGTFELDKDNWETLSANIREWTSGSTYKVGDTVLYNNDIYKCITANNDSAFKIQKWESVNRCNIELWRGAQDPDILALLHFDDTGDPYKNEYGDSFSNEGLNYYDLRGGKFGSCIYSGSGYNYDRRRFSSPSYTFSSNSDVYTMDFWFLANWQSYQVLYTITGTPNAGLDAHGWPPWFFYNTTYAIRAPFGRNSWNHIAYVFTYDTCELYVNGDILVTANRDAGDPIQFRAIAGSGNTDIRMYIDEFRVVKRRMYNGNFNLPTEPYTNPNYEGYKRNDLVVYEDKIYRCIEDNNDVSFTPSKWVEVSKNILYPDWSYTTDYSVDGIVIYQNELYRCITSHTSTNDFNGDYDKWIPLDKNCFIHNWASNIPYYVDEVVKYDDVLYRCKTSHVSTLNDKPSGVILYEATGNTIDIDGTTTIPYTEIMDLGSVKRVTDIAYTESTIDMSFTYNIEVSEDNANYTSWDDVSVDVRYIRLTVDSVNIDAGATSPNAHLADFTVYGDSDKWEKISYGGSAEIVLAREQDIDEMFI